MYKAWTRTEMCERLGLKPEYRLSGFMSYGAWDDEKHFNNLRSALEEIGVKFESRKLQGFLSHVLEFNIDGRNYWFAIVYGGTMLSEYIHFAVALGSKRNIHIGSCGGLYPGISSMDLIIPTWSYGDESTTRMYARDVRDGKHMADPSLSKMIHSVLPAFLKVWNGPIVNNQAMMGETFDDVQSWSIQGFYGVEMETATVFAVSNHFNIPSAALLYVSDNLIKGQVVGDNSHLKEKEAREKVKREVYKSGLRVLIKD